MARIVDRGTSTGAEVSSNQLRLHPHGIVATFYAVAANVRRIIGVPDYTRYLEHTRRCHPDATPLTEREFARDALTRRYSTPGSRCC